MLIYSHIDIFNEGCDMRYNRITILKLVRIVLCE